MFFDKFQNPVVKFIITILLFYVIWFFLYEFFIHPWGKLDITVIEFTIYISKNILELFGYEVFTGVERVIGVDGTGGLWIGDNCNAISLFAIFTGFIVAYPGKLSVKLIFIPLGIIIIEIINIIRIISLAILDTFSRKWTEFNHTYTFTVFVYGIIFLLWILWVNKYSKYAAIRH